MAPVPANTSANVPMNSAAYFFTPLLDLRPDIIADRPGLLQAFFMAAGCLRRIRKWPVQPRCDSWKNWAALRLAFAAYRDHVLEELPGFPDIEHRLSFLLRKIDADFPHHFHHERIDDAWLQARTFRRKPIAADMVQPRFRHLAAGAVMNADEQDVLLCHTVSGRARIYERRSAVRNNSSG